MTVALAAANLVLGIAYTSYGIMTAMEMKRDWKTRGFSHFGAAWIAMAFTCGPHHLVHGIHLGFEGRSAGALDLITVLVGLPFGVVWLLLRIEAFVGGRGDRFISGTPNWLLMAPTVAAIYVTALAAAVMRLDDPAGWRIPGTLYPNMLLAVIYITIGWFLMRTQLRNRPAQGGWSVSGLSLGAVFPTCALMHMMYVAYGAVGVYALDAHGFVVAWVGVPAGLYFLWVVRGLYRETLVDWNRDQEPVVRRPAWR